MLMIGSSEGLFVWDGERVKKIADRGVVFGWVFSVAFVSVSFARRWALRVLFP